MPIVARHYRTGKAVTLHLESTVIRAVIPNEARPENLPWIAPGLVDVQVNGFGGIDFNRPLPHPEAWDHACQALYSHGCTHFLCTLITNQRSGYDSLFEKLEAVRRVRPHNCLGYHLEGPFLNPAPGFHGAHFSAWMTPPQLDLWQKWQERTEHHLRLITLAPETAPEAALSFIHAVTADHVRVALGHSDTRGELLTEAIAAGASAWTHLGNAAPSPAPKFDNVLFHALAHTSLRASLIPDRHHIPPYAFQVLARALGKRLMLTTDAMAGAGAGPGNYSLCHLNITVAADGIARVPGRENLAGSTLTPFAGVFRAAEMSGLLWNDLWDAFSTVPAQWLGFPHEIEPGRDASFCLFRTEPSPTLLATVHRGNWVFGQPD